VGVTHHCALWSPDFPPRHAPGQPELPIDCSLVITRPDPAPRRSSRPPRTLSSIIRGIPPANKRPCDPANDTSINKTSSARKGSKRIGQGRAAFFRPYTNLDGKIFAQRVTFCDIGGSLLHPGSRICRLGAPPGPLTCLSGHAAQAHSYQSYFTT